MSPVSIDPPTQSFIRHKVLRALSSNRAPGMHFAGYFLGLSVPRYDKSGVEFVIEPGAHCSDAAGIVHRAPLIYLADIALAGANRVFSDPSARTATLMLRIEFTGEPANGRLTATCQGSGFSSRTALPESFASGRLTCNGRDVMRMSGTWVSPPAPQGRVMSGLPWEGGENGDLRPLLKKHELEARDKETVRRFEKALCTAPNGNVLAPLCDPLVKRTATGASGKLAVGLHIGNRVGHVQGGFLMHAALVAAEAAVPGHPMLTGASAWYISPGEGKAITLRATLLQQGRNVAVVRTELFNAGRKRVLEVISNHAVAAPK